MKSFIKRCLIAVMIPALLVGMTVFSAGAVAEEEVILSVTAEDIDTFGFRGAVQSALDEAAQTATAELPYTVTVPEGEYDLSYVLRVYSNTTLDLRGVTLKRSGAGAGNMLRVGDEDGVNTGVTGYAYENVRVFGGTFDGNFGENTIIKAFHTKNFTMDDVTVLNEKEGHMTEFAGVDGLTIRGCIFQDQRLTPGNYGYEAIQLDVLHPFHITNGRCEDLPVSNVLIEDCMFADMPRAIGSHTAVHNRPHNNITIRGNVFNDMSSIAIQGLNWTNVTITKNAINNAPRGITLYSEPGGCTYLSSKLAQKGGTQSHVTDAYQAPGKANITINYNILIDIGTSDDKYASYSSQGIAVLGEKLTARSPVDSGDESGGLPAGDYYIDGANIHANFIDVRGNGIRLEDVRNASVASNEIVCSKNTVHKDNYYGVVVRGNASASTVSYNTIMGAEVNGIQLDGTKGGSVTKVRFNRISNCGKYGIGVYDMSIDKIEDNDIMGTKNIGLFANGSKINYLRWNRIRNCSDAGIWLTSTTTATTVKSNTTVSCDDSNSFGKNTAQSHYSSSSALTTFYLPWDTTDKVGAKMGVGSMFHIAPDVRPTNAIATFTYSSSDEEVVTVDQGGMVYAVGEGQATITVKSDNNITKKYVITVEGDGGVSHLTAKPSAPVIILGDADGNGTVESADSAMLMRRIVYIDTPCDDATLSRGNVNGDLSLDVMDVTYIQRYLANIDTPYEIGKRIK
ncbi:right-handed parallel beta-helix repeat-containing protein [uncultured Ruminococcus sp.]|uniref:right-handed parallel beta-helix repeat-containing protein n=1 Tax=uncultured Ruminococcus sp. TaxID=165186 RepID=UPI00292D3C98|nr:right-handed parallel beta-helix repeat-containing protein [uncultured Ruminococcus sp.]